MSSVFPGAIDTDATLYVAKDNIQTRLISAMAAGDTVAVVASSTGWVINMIATVDVEQMFVTGVSGNVITVTRAFGGTTAVAHTAGKNFSNFVDAAYQSTLKESLIAVETALGANLSNVPVVQELYSPTYDFAARVNGLGVSVSGGNLVVGNNTLTFATVPLGVRGSDVGHRLYVSGGTGTAESALITGGSGTPGQTNGQIIINCANTHSGSWQIQSATQGVQEAHNSCVNGLGAVRMPAGNLTFHAPVTIVNSSSIYGSSMFNTKIYTVVNGGAFDARIFAGGTYGNFQIFGPDDSTQQTSGGYGFRLNGSTNLEENYSSKFYNIRFYNLWDGILGQTAYNSWIEGCMFINCGNTGVTCNDTISPDAGGGTITGCSFNWYAGTSRGAAGILVLSTGALRISNNEFSGYSLGVSETGGHSSGMMISNNDFENHPSGCIRLLNTYGRISIVGNSLATFDTHASPDYWAVFISAAQFGTISGNNFYSTGANTVGVIITGAGRDWVVSGNQFYNFLYGTLIDAGCINTVVGTNIYTACSVECPVGADTVLTMPTPMVFGHLTACANGSTVYVTDGQVTSGADNTLIAGGNGALAVRINGVWRAFATQN